MSQLVPDAAARSPEELSAIALNLYYRTDQANLVQTEVTRRKSARAERPLRWIAIAHTFSVVVVAGMLQRALANGNPLAVLAMVISVGLAAAYWALWGWSLVSPLPAAIVGLLLYTSLSLLTSAQNSGMNSSTGLSPIGLITIILLIKAIIDGSHQRILAAPKPNADLAAITRTRSIASAIFLYLVLLLIVLVPRSMAAANDLHWQDIIAEQKIMAVFILTWAALSWRDTFPAIRRIPSPGWMLMGVLLGLCAFVVTSLYTDTSVYLFNGTPAHDSQPFRDAGYSWLGCVGMIALFPAFFEELAFRGIIVPCLNRLLTAKETIAVSAMMFMILHLRMIGAPPLLVAGVLLAIVRLRSGSLWPCVLMHFTHNAMCLAFERWA